MLIGGNPETEKSKEHNMTTSKRYRFTAVPLEKCFKDNPQSDSFYTVYGDKSLNEAEDFTVQDTLINHYNYFAHRALAWARQEGFDGVHVHASFVQRKKGERSFAKKTISQDFKFWSTETVGA